MISVNLIIQRDNIIIIMVPFYVKFIDSAFIGVVLFNTLDQWFQKLGSDLAVGPEKSRFAESEPEENDFYLSLYRVQPIREAKHELHAWGTGTLGYSHRKALTFTELIAFKEATNSLSKLLQGSNFSVLKHGKVAL